VKNRGTFYLHC